MKKNNYEIIKDFPMDVFPEILQRGVKKTYRDNIIQEIMAYNAMLPCLGISLSNKYVVKPDPTKGKWIERANIFTVSIANSGTGKSGILGLFTDPIKSINFKISQKFHTQNQLWLEYDKKFEKMEELANRPCTKSEDYELSIFLKWLGKNGLSSLQTVKNDRTVFLPMKKPKQIVLLSQKGTSEGRDAIFVQNEGRPLLIARDEFTAFFKDLSKFTKGKGGDYEDFLNMYDYSPVATHNVGVVREYEYKCVGMAGTTQESAFRKIFTDEMINTGGLYRFLYVDLTLEVPSIITYFDIPKTGETEGGAINYLQPYDDFIETMYTDILDPPKQIELTLTEEAKIAQAEWETSIINEYKSGALFADGYEVDREEFISIMGKARLNLVRIYIIMSRLRVYFLEGKTNLVEINEDKYIQADDVKRAGKLMKFYLRTIIKIHSEITDYGLTSIKDEKEHYLLENISNDGLQGFELISLINNVFLYKNPEKNRNKSAKRKIKELMQRGLMKKRIDGKYVTKY